MNPIHWKIFVLAGITLIGLGLLVKFGLLGWFGKMPGDIRIERENMRFYFPWVSCLIISAVISLILRFFRR